MSSSEPGRGEKLKKQSTKTPNPLISTEASQHLIREPFLPTATIRPTVPIPLPRARAVEQAVS